MDLQYKQQALSDGLAEAPQSRRRGPGLTAAFRSAAHRERGVWGGAIALALALQSIAEETPAEVRRQVSPLAVVAPPRRQGGPPCAAGRGRSA